MDVDATSHIDRVLTAAWEAQSVWSQTADQLKRSLLWARTAALSLIIVAACAGALVAPAAARISSGAGVGLAWLAAASAGSLAVVQKLASRGQVQGWARARSVSEALKTEVYIFLAGVAPYRGADKLIRFTENVKAVLEKADDLKDKAIGIAPKTRSLPPVNNVESYIAERVEAQIRDYYGPKSRETASRARQFRAAGIAVALIAALLSATASVPKWQAVAAWLPVITTIAAVVTAEAAFHRYEALALEYARTEQQLKDLLIDRSIDENASSAAAGDEFVHSAELVISIQNEAWMARRVAADTTLPAGGTARANCDNS